MVQRLIFDGKRATGVEVESGGERFTVEGDEIILSSGAIGSPQIMLLSGVGPAAHLAEFGIPVVHDLVGVGQNLRDHPIIFVRFKTKEDYPLDGFSPRMQSALRFTAEGSDLRNDLQVLMMSFVTERINRGGDRMDPLGVGMIAVLNLAIGSGELKLTSTDPSTQPSIDYRYLQEEFDRKRLRELVRTCCKLGEHERFSDIIERRTEPTDEELASDDALDVYLLREVTTGQHISGTCKMGPSSDPMAVVDQYGRVHGMEGLRIADASIMPNCIRANTNVTTMVIGERISDFITQG